MAPRRRSRIPGRKHLTERGGEIDIEHGSPVFWSVVPGWDGIAQATRKGSDSIHGAKLRLDLIPSSGQRRRIGTICYDRDCILSRRSCAAASTRSGVVKPSVNVP